MAMNFRKNCNIVSQKKGMGGSKAVQSFFENSSIFEGIWSHSWTWLELRDVSASRNGGGGHLTWQLPSFIF